MLMSNSALSEAGSGETPRSLHILHVADRGVLGRFGPMLTQVVQGLCATGYRNTLLTDEPTAGARLARTPVTCRYRRYLTGWRAWRSGGELANELEPAPNLIHLWGTAAQHAILRWTDAARLPVVVHALGLDDTRRLSSAGLRPNRHYACASAALVTALRRKFPAAARQTHVIVPAVAPLLRAATDRTAGQLLAALCVSPFSDEQGLGVLIDAVSHLRGRGVDLQMAIVGYGAGLEVVWRRARARQVRECVSLVEGLHLWERVLPEVDAYVVPAAEREFSIVPLLAMALGKPVIASRDQLGEWYIENRTAWEFTPGSVVELAYLLTRVQEHPVQAQELGVSARAYVRAQHSVQTVLEDLNSVYRAAVGLPATSPASGNEESGHGPAVE